MTRRVTRSAPRSPRGQSALAQLLDIVASCIESLVPTQVYAVGLGGFGAHSAEKGTQSALIGELRDAVSGFWQRISVGRRAAGVGFADSNGFGGRVAADANEGTDHGTAGPMFVLGDRVHGGFLGQRPSMTGPDQGDLKHGNDFRAVCSTLSHAVLDADPAWMLGASHALPRPRWRRSRAPKGA